jgi:hypothetical protein
MVWTASNVPLCHSYSFCSNSTVHKLSFLFHPLDIWAIDCPFTKHYVIKGFSAHVSKSMKTLLILDSHTQLWISPCSKGTSPLCWRQAFGDLKMVLTLTGLAISILSFRKFSTWSVHQLKDTNGRGACVCLTDVSSSTSSIYAGGAVKVE